MCVCVGGGYRLGGEVCTCAAQKHTYITTIIMLHDDNNKRDIYSMYTSIIAPEEEWCAPTVVYKDHHRHSMGFMHTIFEFWPFCSGRQNDDDG